MSKQTATDALNTFLDTWQDGHQASDLAQKLTCGELDALAELFRENGRDDIADQWIESHAPGDEQGDSHFAGDPVEYLVPIDPADLTQCDSCQ